MKRSWRAAVLVVLLSPLLLHAQDLPGPLELGIVITGAHLHKIDETPVGFGGRALLDVSKRVAFDFEATRYPHQTSVLMGLRSGWRSERFGVFGKARAGMMHFSSGAFERRLERRTLFLSDVGGCLEFYPSRRTSLRIDLAGMIIFYGKQIQLHQPRSGPVGTVHNFQPSVGVGFRF